MSVVTLYANGERLQAEAVMNGRLRAAVLIRLRGSSSLLYSDEINPVASKEREPFIEALSEDYWDEANAVMHDLAQQVAAVRGKVQPEKLAAQTLDVEPWDDVVDGDVLLEALSAQIRRYVHLPHEAADAIAVWVVLTHCVEWLTFAPLLVLASASKRCGKTLVLALIAPICRRGRLTSATGVTPAVLFRLNERDQPTFLLDEAEKLQGRHSDPALLELFNLGHRRGNKVQRCAEIGGKIDIQDFEAFGFRALAMIGKPWDTLADRSIPIPMERKARAISVARFRESVVEETGRNLARQVRRWTTDASAELQAAYHEAQRPLWLGDRDCDNWAGAFAIAEVAGGDWPARIESAARFLAGSRDDDGDVGERLVHDTRAIFDLLCQPSVIPSGELVEKLNAIETSAWGDSRDGRGLSTHALAARFRPFGIKPKAERHPESPHAMVRGYWLADLRSVFERYPAPEPAPKAEAGNTETVATPSAGKALSTSLQHDIVIETDAQTSIAGELHAHTVSSVAALQDDEYLRDERDGMAL